jgi:GNAT superfamily N-acetyltransferase
MQFRAQRQSYSADYPDADHRVILADDQPVGGLLVHRTEKEVRLVDIAVLLEYRNRDLGTALINDLMAECQATRKPLRLQVAKGNRAACSYERLGFLKTGEDEVYDHMWWDPAPPQPNSNPTINSQPTRTRMTQGLEPLIQHQGAYPPNPRWSQGLTITYLPLSRHLRRTVVEIDVEESSKDQQGRPRAQS